MKVVARGKNLMETSTPHLYIWDAVQPENMEEKVHALAVAPRLPPAQGSIRFQAISVLHHPTMSHLRESTT